MQEFICVKKCFWNTLIEEGEVIKLDDKAIIPASIRPFFDVKEKIEIIKIKAEEDEVDRLEKVRAELDVMNKPYDRRWGIAKLESILQIAKRDMQ